ncbi:MAG: hydrogenase maturation protease [Anaerolineae bacterium]
MKSLVIGLGNPLRGDDSAGQRAAEMSYHCIPPGDAEVRLCHQLTPELAEPLSRASLAIFIDARDGGEPGSICATPVEGFGETRHTHFLTPGALVQLARTLYGRTPRAWLITVSAAQFDFGAPLSPEVEAALPELVERVCALVAAEDSVPDMPCAS